MKTYSSKSTEQQETKRNPLNPPGFQNTVQFIDNRAESADLNAFSASINKSPRVQHLIHLQHAANQAAQRKTNPVQRVNLDMTVEEGAQKHHPNYKFEIGTGLAKKTKNIDLDPWITRKGHGYSQLYVGRSDKKALKKLIAGWDTAKSIVDDLVTNYVGQESQTGIDFDEYAHGFVGTDLAMHLMAMQENVARRVGDIPANCNNVNLKINDRLEGESTVRKNVGWLTLLKESREQLKTALLGGQKSPGAMGDVGLVQQAVNGTADPVINELIDLGVLDNEMKLNTSTIRKGTKAYKASNAGGGQFNFGYGHLRFIIFLEWRICSELLLNQSVKE